MRRFLVPILVLTALAVLCWFCLACDAPRIEAQLLDAGRQSLDAARFEAVELELDGRDATLSGTVDSAARLDEALETVAGIPGVRVVEGGQLTIERQSARFGLQQSAETVTLSGLLSSEAGRNQITTRAREIWGAEKVSDEIEIDSSIDEPEWLDGLPTALAAFGQRTDGGSFTLDEGRVTVDGRVFAESARQDLLARLGSALEGVEIDDQLDLRPPATAEELQETLDTAIVERTVEFETNSAELTAVGRAVLDEIFELLEGQPAIRIGISGHTDSRGRASYNLDLSRRRAASARDYLVSRSLAADRFETSGFGGERPIADNDTPEGQRKNRRIEFQVLEEKS